MRSTQYRSSPASIYIYWWLDRSTFLTSRISTEKESFPGSEFKPASIWTCWMLIDRQMQKTFMPELHRWISKLTARHLQILDKSTRNVSRCADQLLETSSSRTVPALPLSMSQRSHQIMRLPRPKKEVQGRSPLYCAPTLWNSLPADLQKLANWNSLKFFFEHVLVCFQHLIIIIPLRSHSTLVG